MNTIQDRVSINNSFQIKLVSSKPILKFFFTKFRVMRLSLAGNRGMWQAFVLGFFLIYDLPSQAALFYPVSLVTKKGSTSTAPLEVLNVKDDKSIRFNPAASGYSGIFKFKYADSLNEKLDSLIVRANYRGSAIATQKWSFSILDVKMGKWVTVSDNSKAVSWVWTGIDVTLPGDPTRFINSNSQISLQYRTATPGNYSQLDYLALESKMSPLAQSPVSQGDYWHPMPGISWQIQYTGTINTTLDVDAYNLDLFDTSASLIAGLHAKGKRVICYFSAGSYENWRADAGNFPASVLGRDLEGWPGEKWLDIRQINLLLPIMKARLELAANKGCDGVDPDNVDGYSNNTGFPLGYNDQLAYNITMAQEAHKLGLAISLKNDLAQVQDLVNYFDFAVNEECFQYNECSLLKPFVASGKPVLGIEYTMQTTSFCPQANSLNFDFLKKNLSLDAARIACR